MHVTPIAVNMTATFLHDRRSNRVVVLLFEVWGCTVVEPDWTSVITPVAGGCIAPVQHHSVCVFCQASLQLDGSLHNYYSMKDHRELLASSVRLVQLHVPCRMGFLLSGCSAVFYHTCWSATHLLCALYSDCQPVLKRPKV